MIEWHWHRSPVNADAHVRRKVLALGTTATRILLALVCFTWPITWHNGTRDIVIAAPAGGEGIRRAHNRPGRHFSDPGVDIGVIFVATGFYREPDAQSDRTASLKPGNWTVLVSRDVSHGWLNVIQVASGRQGWIRADAAQIHYTLHPNPDIAIVTVVSGTQSRPVLAVKNDSRGVVYLHVGSEPEIEIDRDAEKDVSVDAGVWSYNASGPGRIPLFGNSAFVAGDRYTWTFSVGKSATGTRHRPLDPAQADEVRELQADVDARSAELTIKKQALGDEKAALDAASAKLQSDQGDVNSRRRTLDNTDQAAVDAFNSQVDSTNAELQSLRVSQQKYNDDLSMYNAAVDAINAERDRLEHAADAINQQ